MDIDTLIRSRSQQSRTRIGSAKFKAPKPMKSKGPKKPKPPKKDRQKKKTCPERAWAAWLKTLRYNPATGMYDSTLGIQMTWPDFYNRWIRQHPECR